MLGNLPGKRLVITEGAGGDWGTRYGIRQAPFCRCRPRCCLDGTEPQEKDELDNGSHPDSSNQRGRLTMGATDTLRTRKRNKIRLRPTRRISRHKQALTGAGWRCRKWGPPAAAGRHFTRPLKQRGQCKLLQNPPKTSTLSPLYCVDASRTNHMVKRRLALAKQKPLIGP